MRLHNLSAAVVLALAASEVQAQLVRSGAGPDPASIQTIVDQYRADLGTLNPNIAGSFGSGRRQIDWDGTPDAFSAPNDLPGDFFNTTSPRGAVFSTPGSAVQVSADSDNPSGAAVRFGNINASYVDEFQAFSEERLFSPIGSNVVDMFFFVPGTNTPAVSRGFGAVYTDVDVASNTSFEFFDVTGASLGAFSTPVSDQGLSFLGVSFDQPVVRHVRISYGNTALGPVDARGIDVAVMDDFIYGEPVAVPEPAMWALVLLGGLTMLGRRRLAP